MRNMAASWASARASSPTSRSQSPSQQVRATRYRFITPYLAGSIWYDDGGLWVHGEFERDAAHIIYQLDA